MALSFAGNGTITGLSVGGLPDGTVDADTLASGVGGKVLQIQSSLSTSYGSTTASIPFDDTIPQNTEGTELVTLSFTPKSSSSKLLFIYGGHFNMGTGGNQASGVPIALFVDSTANAIATSVMLVDGGGTRVSSSWNFHLETNSSTSARTYKMRYCEGEGSGTAYVNGDTSARKFGGQLASGFYVIEFADT